MTEQWIHLMWPLVAIMFVIAVLGGWLLIEMRGRPWIKAFLIPALMLGAWMSQDIYLSGLGRAVPTQLPPKFVYMGHHVIVRSAEKTSIELWIGDGKGTRLVVIPYERKVEQALDEANSKGQRGGIVVIELVPGEGVGTGKSEAHNAMKSNLIVPNQLEPKHQ